MKTAALCLLLAVALSLSAAELHIGATINLTPDEMQACIDGGGCMVITRQHYESLRGDTVPPKRAPSALQRRT